MFINSSQYSSRKFFSDGSRIAQTSETVAAQSFCGLPYVIAELVPALFEPIPYIAYLKFVV